MNSGSDKREHPRIAVETEFRLSINGREYTGKTSNISENGAFLVVPKPGIPSSSVSEWGDLDIMLDGKMSHFVCEIIYVGTDEGHLSRLGAGVQRYPLEKLEQDSDSIYYDNFQNEGQEEEIALRKRVSHRTVTEPLRDIARHHSIPVMDREVELFLKEIPQNAKILDIGGCWGWHWRRIAEQRPDVSVYIVDFIHSHLLHAKQLLGPLIGKQIFLIHADATQLKFDNETFDACWTVQCFQHIPGFNQAVSEAYRVLKPNGLFVNYSWNIQRLVQWLYKRYGKPYYTKGNVPNRFYLERANKAQIATVAAIFGNAPKIRYSEILFSPELGFTSPGAQDSFLGKIDSYLSGNSCLLAHFARQQSFHVRKSICELKG